MCIFYTRMLSNVFCFWLEYAWFIQESLSIIIVLLSEILSLLLEL